MTGPRLQLLAELASEAADYAASDSPAWAWRMTDAAEVARAMAEREDRELELQRIGFELDAIKGRL